MGKTLEDLMAELERKARERMKASQPNSSATIYEDSGATVPENSDATVCEDGNVTVPEPDATICEDGGITVPGNETVSEKPMRESSSGTYEKGQTILDTYTVVSDPIHGGMGSVWRVHHNGWNVDLAMKRPQAKLFQSEKQKENFIGECEAWINLGLHPNIVSCYYVREIDGVPTIFSEWMENGSLENHIQKGTLYTGSEQEQQERLLDIAIQFARGLHYAHEQGLIHQDVKPDNVLLSKDWDAKVADFGLAKARAVLTVLEGENTVRDAGATVMAPSGGYTPAYCSMEQMDGKPLTRRTDIYSWAVSVMEMYLGERLWDNGVVAGYACENYFPDCRVKMPEALKALLKNCMAAQPEGRPHDFAVVKKELLKIYNDATGKEYPIPSPVTSPATAEALNNRALSMLDLGKNYEAEVLFRDARIKNPFDIIVAYNYCLFNLRQGRISKNEAIALMQNCIDTVGNIRSRNECLFYFCEILIEAKADYQSYLTVARQIDSHTLKDKLYVIHNSSGKKVSYEIIRITTFKESAEQEVKIRKKLEEIKQLIDNKAYFDADRELHSREGTLAIGRAEWNELYYLLSRKGMVRFLHGVIPLFDLNISSACDKSVSFTKDSAALFVNQHLYDLNSGVCINKNQLRETEYNLNNAVVSNISADGKYYLKAIKGERSFHLIETDTNTAVRTFKENAEDISELIITENMKILISVDQTGEVAFRKINEDKPFYIFRSPDSNVKKIKTDYCAENILVWVGADVYHIKPAEGFSNLVLQSESIIGFDVNHSFSEIAVLWSQFGFHSGFQSGLYYISFDKEASATGMADYLGNVILQETPYSTSQAVSISYMPDDRRTILRFPNNYFMTLDNGIIGRITVAGTSGRCIISPNSSYAVCVNDEKARLYKLIYLYQYPSEIEEHIHTDVEDERFCFLAKKVCATNPDASDEQLCRQLADELADIGYGFLPEKIIRELIINAKSR